MNIMFQLYSVVRVKRLLHPEINRDGWKINQRSPEIGDTGTIVEILHAPNLPIHYVVECANKGNGTSIWVSEFEADEIEAV